MNTIQPDEWEDVIVWDQAHILSVAKELVHNAFLARKDGNARLCSSYVSKALDTLSDCQDEYPNAVQALRDSLEKI